MELLQNHVSMGLCMAANPGRDLRLLTSSNKGDAGVVRAGLPTRFTTSTYYFRSDPQAWCDS